MLNHDCRTRSEGEDAIVAEKPLDAVGFIIGITPSEVADLSAQLMPAVRHQCAPRGPAALAVGGIGAGDRRVTACFVGVVS